MDERTVTERRDRAMEAARILNSAVFRDALDAMDAQYVSAWRAAREQDEREHWWRMQNCVATLRRELFRELQGAALRSGGKDGELYAALDEAKGRWKMCGGTAG